MTSGDSVPQGAGRKSSPIFHSDNRLRWFEALQNTFRAWQSLSQPKFLNEGSMGRGRRLKPIPPEDTRQIGNGEVFLGCPCFAPFKVFGCQEFESGLDTAYR